MSRVNGKTQLNVWVPDGFAKWVRAAAHRDGRAVGPFLLAQLELLYRGRPWECAPGNILETESVSVYCSTVAMGATPEQPMLPYAVETSFDLPSQTVVLNGATATVAHCATPTTFNRSNR